MELVKAHVSDDVDFWREGVRALVEPLMEVEVTPCETYTQSVAAYPEHGLVRRGLSPQCQQI